MQTLEQWLEVATRGLCDAAAERVHAEIGEHYLSAIESAGALDVDSPNVECRAVAALGDAKIANREYRRVLLTEGEADLLRRLTGWHFHQLVAILLLIATAIYAISVRTSQFNYLFATFVVEAVLRTIPISSIRVGWVVRIFRWGNQTVFYTMWFGILAGLGTAPPVIKLIMFLPMVLGAAHMEYRLFVIRRKVPIEQWPRRLWV